MESAYHVLYLVVMVGFALCMLTCLIRAIKGPKTMDRIVAINMIGTMAIIEIILMSLFLGEDFLLDVDLIYAMLSFLAVVVLTKVYMGVHREEEIKKEKKNAQKEGKE